MTEDAELLRRYAEEKSERAFAELVERHLNFVYGGALRRLGGDAQLAEDVTQQVFTALARAAAALSRRPVLTGWLYTTTRFASAQAVRTERRRRTREQEAHTMNELSADSPPPADWERLRPVLDDTMDELDERDREAVLLRFFEERSFADIGAKLELNENAARMRVERALDKLHALLARRGITSTIAALALALASQAGVAAPAGLGATVTGSALATAAAGSGAAAGLAYLTFMSTTKIAVGTAVGVIALAIGGAIYQANENRASRAALAAAEQERDEARGQIRKLQGELEAQIARVRAADDDNARLLAAIRTTAPTRAAQVAQAAEANAPVTQDAVQTRYNKAKELARSGDWAAALSEFLWCYDEGMVRVQSFVGVRGSFLLSDIGRMAKNYPPALAALQERRDRAEQRMLASPTDRDATRDYASINAALGEDAQTLKVFDQLSADDPRRTALGSLLSVYDLLVDAQRYGDAARAVPYDRALSLFTSLSRTPQTASLPESATASLRRSVVDRASKNVEVLAGSGDVTHAGALVEKVLAYDSSDATKAVLQQHLIRAGHPELMSVQPKP